MTKRGTLQTKRGQSTKCMVNVHPPDPPMNACKQYAFVISNEYLAFIKRHLRGAIYHLPNS